MEVTPPGDPPIAVRVAVRDLPALEVRVNFGVFAGREATPAEIDALAQALRSEVPTFSIVAEQRHEFAGDVEASVHQVAIELPGELTDADREALGSRIELLARSWASDCVTRRHVEL